MIYLLFRKIAYIIIIWIFLSSIIILHLKNNNKISSKIFKRIALFNLTGKKSPTSIGGAMNCPIVF